MTRSPLLLIGLLIPVAAATPVAPPLVTTLLLQSGEFVTVRVEGPAFEVVTRETGQPATFLRETGVRFSLGGTSKIPLLMVENRYRHSLIYHVRSIPGGRPERNCAVPGAVKFQPLPSSIRRIEISEPSLAPPGPGSCSFS